MIRNWIEVSQLYLTISLCSDSVSCIPPAWLAPHSATCARCAWQLGFRKAVLWGWRSTLLNLGWIQKGGVTVPGSKLRRAWIISRGGSYMSDKISPIPFSMLEITKLLNNSEPFLILQESFCNIKAVSDICQRTYLFPSSRKAPCCADIARGWLTLHTVSGLGEGPCSCLLASLLEEPLRREAAEPWLSSTCLVKTLPCAQVGYAGWRDLQTGILPSCMLYWTKQQLRESKKNRRKALNENVIPVISCLLCACVFLGKGSQSNWPSSAGIIYFIGESDLYLP